MTTPSELRALAARIRHAVGRDALTLEGQQITVRLADSLVAYLAERSPAEIFTLVEALHVMLKVAEQNGPGPELDALLARLGDGADHPTPTTLLP